MCKIRYKKLINNKMKYVFGSGFFLELNIKGIPFNKCLITNNHVLNEDYFKANKEIQLDYNNDTKVIQIGKRCLYTCQILDFTCIEIYDNDDIKRFFLINQQILLNNIDIFLNKDIFILQFANGEDLSFSNGKILTICGKDIFIHDCSTLGGSSGSPIILREDSSVIGLHQQKMKRIN